MLVEDRNGNPKKLRKKEYALATSHGEGSMDLRDGSLQDPINLKHLQKLLNGSAVLVKNQQGIVGAAVPVEDDTFLAYVGGTLQFVKTIPKDNVFRTTELSSQTGKLAIIGCSTSGSSELGYLTDSGEYLSVIDGVASAKDFCDAADTEELDYILGCSGDTLSKIAPKEGVILAEENGKWVLREQTTEEVAVFGANIYTKTFSSVADLTFPDTQVSFGSGVPSTAKWVQIRVTTQCAISTTYGRTFVYVNGAPVIATRTQGSFSSHQGSTALYVPYGTGSFTLRGEHIVGASGSATAGGELAVGVLSYR